jgi:hypothetical protein
VRVTAETRATAPRERTGHTRTQGLALACRFLRDAATNHGSTQRNAVDLISPGTWASRLITASMALLDCQTEHIRIGRHSGHAGRCRGIAGRKMSSSGESQRIPRHNSRNEPPATLQAKRAKARRDESTQSTRCSPKKWTTNSNTAQDRLAAQGGVLHGSPLLSTASPEISGHAT